jgi:hypothetical protein
MQIYELKYIQEQISAYQHSGGQSTESFYIFDDIKRVFENLRPEGIPAIYRTKFLKVKWEILAKKSQLMRESSFTYFIQLFSTIESELQDLITSQSNDVKEKPTIGFKFKE